MKMDSFYRRRLILLIIAVSAFNSIILFAEEESRKEQIIKAEVELTEQQRATRLAKVDAMGKQAEKLALEGKMAESLKMFLDAQKILSETPGNLARRKAESFQKLIQSFRGKWASQLMSKARMACVQGKYESAINLASEAALMDARKNSEVADFVKYCNKKIKDRSFKNETTLTNFDKSYTATEDDIKLLYREAMVMYQNGRYAEARTKIERIFLKDPYNRQAIFLLSKVYDKLYEIARKRREADNEEMIAQADWTWMQPVLPTETRKQIKGGATAKESSSGDLYEKMRNIIFPVVEFDQASIKSVIIYLSKMSKRYDPDGEGVNIVSGLNSKTVEGLMVQMSFSKMPMSEILRYLCKYTGLKYKIENNVVVIGSGGDIDPMDTRSFSVRAAMIADIAGVDVSSEGGGEGGMLGGGGGGGATAAAAPAGGGGGGGGGDTDSLFDPEATFDTSAKASAKLTPTAAALIKYFEDRGIKFEAGASISYNKRAGKLFVKNTRDNLRKLETLLRQLDIDTPLVLVEAKIVELAQKDIEELGFDWAFSVNNSLTSDSKWYIPENDNPLRHYSSESFNSSSDSSTSKPFKVINDLKIFPNFGKSLFGEGNDVNLSLTVNAVCQNERTEALASPKVITTSGSRATIKMVREEYYPSSWEEPEIETNNNTVVVKHAVPEFDDPTSLGVLFDVEPTVGPDNYTITLHLIPQVVEFLQWTRYEYFFQYTTGSGSVNTITSEIKMPEITRRDLDIKVKVYDGETIVVGGMVDSKSVYRDDKWPVLGEVPVLGRFFRSQLSYMERTSLLIFVTTRLINNDGVPVRSKNRGVTEFFR